ncbi:MAG: hypothetical protein U0942_15925 [Parvibaculum sp.]|uniref:hypothetical protein n=1 Tax=Parvibaculum sp. TaxID=2024848 RepID=UPI002ABC9C58|nr:hypothetical protein [Parvibaculum sp.]MDZ4382820.1 hypothetical protein [Parvibaculum sp.]
MKRKRETDREGLGAPRANLREPSRDKDARKAARREARRRADLVRGSALARCLMRKVIDRRMFEAGCAIRQLCVDAAPGVAAVDWLRDRVGGGTPLAPGGDYSWDAERRLRALLRDCAMGAAAAEVVLKVCAQDMFLTAVAIDLEESADARANGACSRETIAIARHLLRSGLNAAWHHLHKRAPARRDAAMIVAWMGEGVRPALEGTALGERADIGVARSSATRSG